MVALNFQKQFAAAVESGAKRRTIRAPRKDNRLPKFGDMLQLYTGMRTRSCRKLGDAVCMQVRPITIDKNGVTLDGFRLIPLLLAEFAAADGFPDFEAMADFFEKSHGLPFSGFLIEWGELI